MSSSSSSTAKPASVIKAEGSAHIISPTSPAASVPGSSSVKAEEIIAGSYLNDDSSSSGVSSILSDKCPEESKSILTPGKEKYEFQHTPVEDDPVSTLSLSRDDILHTRRCSLIFTRSLLQIVFLSGALNDSQVDLRQSQLQVKIKDGLILGLRKSDARHKRNMSEITEDIVAMQSFGILLHLTFYVRHSEPTCAVLTSQLPQICCSVVCSSFRTNL
jgi:hypothetical protein